MFSKQLKIPQISPINWIFLFFLFNFSLFLIIIKVYYTLNKIITKKEKLNINNNSLFLIKL